MLTLNLTRKRVQFLQRIGRGITTNIRRDWRPQYEWARTARYVVYDDAGKLVLTAEAKEHLKCRK